MDGIATLADREAWARRQFGAADLGDRRRTQRAVWFAARAAADSDGSIPRQVGSAAGMKAVYRLFSADGVTHNAVTGPHIEQTRAAAGAEPLIFLIQDTTELDFSTHHACKGLAPVGRCDGYQQGLHQQNVLAISAATRRPLGLIYQKHHRRCVRPKGHRTDRAAQRKVPLAERESAWWLEAIDAIGPPPPGVRWVHVGDRGEDFFAAYDRARTHKTDWLIRAAHDRSIVTAVRGGGMSKGRLFGFARSRPGCAGRTVTVRNSKEKTCRQAELRVAFGAVRLPPVKFEAQLRGCAPVDCGVVRVWEPRPPAGVTGVEWVLLTSLPCASAEEALAVAEGYALRWQIEEFHKCLKTGCGVETRRLEHTDRLEPLIGMLSVLALWLLTLKVASREDPARPAAELLDAGVVGLMAGYLKSPAAGLTLGAFWRGIGLLGGHPGRKGDGPVGWLRAWYGWQRFQLMLMGADIANTNHDG
jgi:hypothetical protein